jgi:tetratricopeptide (TPR) repeat protein
MALLSEDDLSESQALVIDCNHTSRSILVAQLRDFGMGTIVQCARLADARRLLEYRKFDVVLCENYFEAEATTGQELLDDLRRNQLLPFSTIFIMVTGEATYGQVAEAAESALDGFLLKPHRAVDLGERMRQARVRKLSLKEILTAVEEEDFELAADLCLERFEAKGKFWLYAARIGAELLMRVGKFDQAQALYEAVVAAKTLPWAKLGVARALLEEGQTAKAETMLEGLMNSDPGFVDAYDVMGRAQFELGNFDRALATYKMASDLTPSSISRLQNYGMLTFYNGDKAEAEKILDRTARIGLDSKMFDCQTLVLLAFARLESSDKKGLQRCRDDFVRLIDKNPESQRHQRLAAVVDVLFCIQDKQFARCVESVRAMIKTVKQPSFNFESATNMVALVAQLAKRSIQLEEVEPVVETIGLRFCSSRAIAELLAAAASAHEPYAETIRAAQARILKLSSYAMSLSMGGDPRAAVENLMTHGAETCNGKLIETAYMVLHRYTDKIRDARELTESVQGLRTRFKTHSMRPALGEANRQAGGLTLRTNGATAGTTEVD